MYRRSTGQCPTYHKNAQIYVTVTAWTTDQTRTILRTLRTLRMTLRARLIFLAMMGEERSPFFTAASSLTGKKVVLTFQTTICLSEGQGRATYFFLCTFLNYKLRLVFQCDTCFLRWRSKDLSGLGCISAARFASTIMFLSAGARVALPVSSSFANFPAKYLNFCYITAGKHVGS
jgi:hypothetical protein